MSDEQVAEIGYAAAPPNCIRFKQVACGARHSIALSEEGRVFTFGSVRLARHVTFFDTCHVII